MDGYEVKMEIKVREMEIQKMSKKKHDLLGALSSLYGVVEAIKAGGFDFDSEDGRELLAQADQAYPYLKKEIDSLVTQISSFSAGK